LEDYQSLINFARGQGFAVTQTYSNRVVLDVNASVADIEKAFHISLHLFQHPTEDRTFFAPQTEPSVDSTVPIVDISGLDNFKLPRPLLHKVVQPLNAGPQPAFGSGPGGTFRGNDFRAAYAPNVAVTGLGQTVGLLEFDGYNASDITSYETQSGLPSVQLTNVLLDGFNGSAGSANIEVALDIEVAIAMAPGLSQVIVYEAGPSGFPNDILNRMANDNVAKQLSSSWTWSGGPSATTDNIFQQLAAQGQSFFQASGDDDAYTGAIPEPADNPYITVVGGTTLSTSGPGGTWTSEKAWNWYNNGSGTNGSSGGVSTSYSIPTWQQSVSMSSNQGSTTMRNIPDVALTADNVWVTYNNGSSGAVGGTSCAAPLWAGFMALINQQAIANGKQPIGFLNPSIYTIGTGGGYGSAFHDITTGNNTNKSSPTKFSAVSGFDLCTGWGTPAGNGLINALAGAPTPQVVSNSLSLVSESCSNNAVDPGETVTMNFGLINVGSASTANLVATLQSSGGVTPLSGAQTYGALTASGSPVVHSFSFTANGNCGGIITATLQLQDGASNLGTVSFTIRLGAVVNPITFSENFDGVSSPALPSGWSTAVTSGIQANWATTNGFSDTAPNSAFAPDTGSAAQTDLVSPMFPIASSSAQLTFRHNYNLAKHSHLGSTTYYDGGVLQISIGGGTFSDILSAGGSFVSGGYNCTLSATTGNSLGGAQAWGGNSGGWVTTTVNLPAAAAGQNVQLKWALGTGVNTSVATGWFVDSISVQDTSYICCTPGADVGVSQSAAPNPGAVGQNLVYTLNIANAGPSSALNVAVTDSLPSSVTFVSASPGCINLGGSIACTIGTMGSGTSSNILITVTPTSAGALSNNVSVTSTTTDPNASNNSSVNTISVYVPPSITSQPTNQTTSVGGSATFSVNATGSTPLTYQWTFGGSAIAGATTSTLTLANVQSNQAGNYAVIVGNPAGSVASAVVSLTVLLPPSISAQPTNETVIVGANAGFQAGATGTAPLNYRWMFNGAPLSGATASALALNNVQTNQAGGYCVVVTNSAGVVTSTVATLSVLVPPSFTSQPSSQTVAVGRNAVFQAAASGSSPLSYQWFFSGNTISGATTTTLGLTNVQPNQAGNYSLVVTNPAGAATSVVAQLTVLLPPTITNQPTNQTVAAGGNANFQVNVSGTAPLAYQWWFNGTNAVGLNTNALTLANVQSSQAGSYSVVITNSAGSVTSAVATLMIGTPPGITQQPSNVTVIQGQNATFNLVSSGSGPLSYQWCFNSNPISGGTSSSYTVNGATAPNSGGYEAIVSNAYGSLTSAVAQLTVLVPPTITTQPTNQTVAAGTAVNFQVNASGTSPLSYQWWFNGTNAAGLNTNTFTLANVQPNQAGGYSVTVVNSAGSITSAVATLTVGTPPGISQQPSNVTVIQGQNATFSLVSSGSAPLGYQWCFNSVPISGGTSSSYTVNGATSASSGGYEAIVSNAYGSLTSAVAQLTVLVPPAITTQPTNQTVPAGTAVNFQVNATGTSALNYQWWFNGTNAVGVGSNVLTIANVQAAQAGGYNVVVTNSAGSITSVVATLTIGTSPSIMQQPSGQAVVQGQSATFNVAAAGPTPLGYQWRYNGTPIASATSSTYTIASVTPLNAGAYDAVINNNYGSITSAVAQLSVLVPPTITTQPSNQIVIAGGNANFQVSASGTSPLNYQWWFNGTNAIGSNTNALTLSSARTSQAGNYSVVVSNAAGIVTSAVATLTVGTPPGITQQPASLTVSQGQNATFNLLASGDTPLSYQWRFNGSPIASATSSGYTITAAAVNNAGSYDAIVSNSYGSLSSVVAQLTVLVAPVISAEPTNQSVSAGNSASFAVSVTGTAPLSYQWWFNATNAVGSNTNVLNLSNAQPNQAGSYSVVISNSAGAVTSTVATLTLLLGPTINSQPTNLTVVAGANASFFASATGTAPMGYQWLFNGNQIPGSTSATLSLINVQTTQAGTYAVVVTNSAGSATSSGALLRVLVAPSINSPAVTGNSFSVPVATVAGLNYLLEYKGNLLDSAWSPTSSWTPGNGGIIILQDNNTPAGSRFYRVRCQ
jgi:uncharacterized repeat protein (TIGR01451 family)